MVNGVLDFSLANTGTLVPGNYRQFCTYLSPTTTITIFAKVALSEFGNISLKTSFTLDYPYLERSYLQAPSAIHLLPGYLVRRSTCMTEVMRFFACGRGVTSGRVMVVAHHTCSDSSNRFKQSCEKIASF